MHPFQRIAVAGVLVAGSAVLVSGCTNSSSIPIQTTGAKPHAAPRELTSIANVEDSEIGKIVSFFGSDVTDVELEQLADLENVCQLTLQECREISDQGLAALESATALKLLRLIRVPVSDEGLKHLRAASSLDELLLAHTEVTGAGLEHLAGTPIARLSIHSSKVTPSGLASLVKLTSLRELELHCPAVRIEDLASFAPLARLELLVAERTPLGPNGLEKLRNHGQLRKLVVSAVDLKDDSLAVLRTLPELEELSLAHAQITDDGLKQFASSKLKRLTLMACERVSDKGLENLGGLTALEYLDVTESGVQGVDLTGLAVITTLREVTMSGDQFKGNAASIEALKELLPNCVVQILRG